MHENTATRYLYMSLHLNNTKKRILAIGMDLFPKLGNPIYNQYNYVCVNVIDLEAENMSKSTVPSEIEIEK